MRIRISIFFTLLGAVLLLAACRQEDTPTDISLTPTAGPAVVTPDEQIQPARTAPSGLPPDGPTTTSGATFSPPVSSLDPLPPGWTKIEPGGETRCAHGTPYAFWVRPGAADKLLVFFQGGGGCWDADTCAPGSQYYKQRVSEADHPANARGIFDLENPENPFQDYTLVFIPYCTGDVHWGNHVQVYARRDGSELDIHHQGFANASSALQWAYTLVPAPESVFVSGCSAGSAGSILAAPYLIERYPQARVVQVGDSLSFTFQRPVDLEATYRAYENFPTWIPALESLPPEEFSLARFYTTIANHYPEHIFSQYNTTHDQVQEFFFHAGGGQPGGFAQALQADLADIHANAANFRSYTVQGGTHCILPLDRFYLQEAAGVRFRDWVTGLVRGEDVPDVKGGRD